MQGANVIKELTLTKRKPTQSHQGLNNQQDCADESPEHTKFLEVSHKANIIKGSRVTNASTVQTHHGL